MAFRRKDGGGDTDVDVDIDMDGHAVAGAPVRYVPLDRVYSSTSPFSSSSSSAAAAGGSSGVMSKKVKARKVVLAVESRFCGGDDGGSDGDGSERKHRQLIVPHSGVKRPPIINVYSRRSKKPRAQANSASLLAQAESGFAEGGGSGKKKKRKTAATGKLGLVGELAKLGVDSEVLSSLERPRLRDCRNYNFGGKSNAMGLRRKKPCSEENGNGEKVSSDSAAIRRWVR